MRDCLYWERQIRLHCKRYNLELLWRFELLEMLNVKHLRPSLFVNLETMVRRCGMNEAFWFCSWIWVEYTDLICLRKAYLTWFLFVMIFFHNYYSIRPDLYIWFGFLLNPNFCFVQLFRVLMCGCALMNIVHAYRFPKPPSYKVQWTICRNRYPFIFHL